VSEKEERGRGEERKSIGYLCGKCCEDQRERWKGSGKEKEGGAQRRMERVFVVEEGIGELASGGIEGRQGEGRGGRRGERGLIDLRKQVD